ncbi:polysaccharide deacetylase family protein [Bacillus carboniphilus]|uniref:Polysaccharide deacetylase family protein n=1 Tax=Bacillus carboniphilus TaxID=86663 RepID=A0ABY9JRR1_9BACI|nr:polysaccharide deacetylase family protein [Bacillus carboniphilus]WLR42085.1 polysaccharide deacetylase family protein [Bacillus carboniphilus]
MIKKLNSPLFKISFVLALIFTLCIPAQTKAQESQLDKASIYFDNVPYTTKYIVVDGHLLVPAILLKRTGAFVDWNEKYQSIVFQTDKITFSLPIGTKYYDEYNSMTKKWKRGTLTAKSTEVDGEYYVPLVDVIKKLGMKINYDSKLKRSFITSNITVKKNLIQKVNTQDKLVTLTFDDGPDGDYTAKILDILKEKGVKATFFVVGKQVATYPEVMKRIVKEGHGIGNHSWDHPYITKIWSSDVKKQIQSTQTEIKQVTGRKPDLFRPPYGFTTKADIKILNELGMRNVKWSIDTLDWSGTSADEIIEIIKRDTTPGGIVLQHNAKENSRALDGTVEALPTIIDELRKKGYTFVTVQTLLDHQK